MRTRLRRPASRRLAAGLALVALLGVPRLAETWSAFSATTDNAGSSIAAAPDFIGPTVSPQAAVSTTSGRVGHVYPGGDYQLYAQVDDTGNPASGVSTVSANVTNLTSGQTATAFTSGTYSLDGTGYNWRSATLTAGSTLGACTVSYTTTATDAVANSTQQAGSAMVDRDLLDDYNVRLEGEYTGGGDELVTADAGDVNGDGRPDMLVGAPFADRGGRADSGAVYVLDGPTCP